MEFLGWHYTEGIRFYLLRYWYSLRAINHYFSLNLLLFTLFAPWKRLVERKTRAGFDLVEWFERMSFNLVSRGIGAVVRLVLFLSGFLILAAVAVGGLLGLLVWVVIPLLSIKIYLMRKGAPREFAERLAVAIKRNPESGVKMAFENEAGKFVLQHVGLTLTEISAGTKLQKIEMGEFVPESYEQLVAWLVEKGAWEEEFFRRKAMTAEDLVRGAAWWDRKRGKESLVEDIPSLGSPGIGLELLYGYTPTLDKFSINLGLPQSFSHHLIGRQNVVSRMERVLTSGNSVVLVGPPGVGKKTVVLEFAQRARRGQLGAKMTYKRVLELDFNFLFSESIDLNQKKARLAGILGEAASAGNVILVMRDLHRVTHPDLEGLDFTDVFESYLEKRELMVIAIAANHEYERFIAPNMRLRKFLETVEVTQPTKEEAMEILLEAAENWERRSRVVITVEALREVLKQSDRYISETPFPEKALEVLDAVVMYEEQEGGDGVVNVDDVNSVLAEKTGVSFTRITEGEKKKLTNLEEIIHERLIDQEVAVRLIAQILRGKAVGVVKTDRPLGSFLFLGPTGVGKTETAKVLAEVYYGSSEQILRFDMAEYAGKEGLERLIGTAAGGEPGGMTTAIKNRPASLLLLDEIEKAPAAVFNLFLTLLDEGMMTDAMGRKINCRHLFVVATSNAGAEYIRKLVSKGVKGEELQRKVVDYVLKKQIFSPEFVNRFDGTVVYEPLGKSELTKIAQLMVDQLAKNLKEKGVGVEFNEEALTRLVELGYDPAFGARPMRRVIEIEAGDMIGKAILAGEIKGGDEIVVLAGEGKEKFGWKKR